MCNSYVSILLMYILFHRASVLSFNFNSNDNILSPKDLKNEKDSLNLPPSLKFKISSVPSLPTNEDEMFSSIPNTTQHQLDREKEIEEINESIKNNEIISKNKKMYYSSDPITKEKLFQNVNGDESKEEEDKEVSLGKSGSNYKEGVDSATDELNDISRKLESDGGVTDSNDIQLRENLLDKIMKKHDFENIGA